MRKGGGQRNRWTINPIAEAVGIGGGLWVALTLGVIVGILLAGCTTSEIIEAAGDLRFPHPDDLPPAALTNIVPAKPVAVGCGCDLSKPATIFASPVHGQTEAQVGAWLRQRWVEGKRDSCDGLPRDVRPQALNPSGKPPYNWKYAILGGGVTIRFDGDNMAVSCGDVTVDGQTQRWHVVGCTNTEDGRKAADWTPMTPGVLVGKKHFVCFEIRNK